MHHRPCRRASHDHTATFTGRFAPRQQQSAGTPGDFVVAFGAASRDVSSRLPVGVALTPRQVCHRDLRETIAQLNPVLRGWGAYFRTGNAAAKFGQVDDYVNWRLKRLLVKRHGRQLRAGQATRWTGDFFHALGLHRLRGTIRYPEAA